MSKLHKLIAPNGRAIIGSAETISATAHVLGGWRSENGDLQWDCSGQSQVHWDSQITETKDGKAIFVDDLGNEWTEDQLIIGARSNE